MRRTEKNTVAVLHMINYGERYEIQYTFAVLHAILQLFYFSFAQAHRHLDIKSKAMKDTNLEFRLSLTRTCLINRF